MSWPGRPPSADVLLGTPQTWARLSREDAVRFCRMLPVAVVYTNYGHSQSAWFGPASPFYTVDGPYDYASLRYFAFSSGGSSMVWGKSGGTARKSKPGGTPAETEREAFPAEEFEPLEEPPTAPPAPRAPTPPAPKAPAAPKPAVPQPPVPPVPPVPPIPPVPPVPPVPPIPPVPQAPQIPTVPQPPQLPEIPKVPEVPPAPEVPGIPALPKLPPKEKLPIEIQLLDSQGKAQAGAAYELRFPDGSSKEGVTGSDGFIKVPDNELPGEVELILKEGKK